VEGEDEIGRFKELGGGHNYKCADENRRGLVIRAGENACVGDRADGAIVSGKF